MTSLRMVPFLAFGGWLLWVSMRRTARLYRHALELSPAPAAWLGRGTALLWGLVMVTLAASRLLPRDAVSLLAWVGYTALGVYFIAWTWALPLELLALRDWWLARRVRILVQQATAVGDTARAAALQGAWQARLSRRDALKFGLAAVGAIASASTSVLAWFEGRRAPAIVRVPVALPRLARPYRIAQISDVHIGPTHGREFMQTIVDAVMAESPDLVVITGDLVDGTVEQLADSVEPVRALRGRDGCMFVTGNHEFISGAAPWREHLRSLGVRVLSNECVNLEALCVAGTEDHAAARFGQNSAEDVAAAVAGRDPTLPLVLLAHQPKTIRSAAQHGVDLQLSGHTHGGQIAPWDVIVRLDQPYLKGLHVHGDGDAHTQIYVSCGTGSWGPPMRLGTRAEITLLELRPA